MNCKYCQSPDTIKYGVYKGIQRYFCKFCHRKFSDNKAIPKMQTPTHQIADALNMYYEGLSLSEIRRNLIQQHNNYISRISAYNWVERFTELAVKEAGKYRPKVGGVWVADETMIDLDGKNVWFWDLIDTKTRFLLASHMSYTRTSEDARILMEKAFKKAGRYPRIIYTDKLRAYLEGIEQTFGCETTHIQGSPFDIEKNTNLIERFHSTLKERTKVMRGLHTIKTARLFLDGWLVHYNFFRPHMSLRDKTPAEVASIRFPYYNWRDIVEQPYEITARIPIGISSKPRAIAIELKEKVIKPKAKRKRIKHKVRQTLVTPTTTLSTTRL
jgi:putative transposase